MICLLTAATFAGNITIVTESQNILVKTNTVNIETVDSEATLNCKDTQIVSQSGEPAIPSKIIKILLPPDADLSTVTCVVQSTDYEPLEGALDIKPVPGMGTRIDGAEVILWPEGKKIVNGKDVAIYEANALWPRKSAGIVSAGKLRNFKIVEIAVPLAVCSPADKKLWLLTDAVVCIEFERTARIDPVDTLGQKRTKNMVVNFGQYADEYDVAMASTSSTGYTILTTSAIQSASTKLADFVSHKEARGFAVQVVTESVWGGGTGKSAGGNIQSWLQNNYITDDIKYVLLIGNPDPKEGDVAMLKEGSNPTDFFYSDLTGDDRIWEVVVGRIPYYGIPADLDHILQKTMDYENETDLQWRRNVLLPMVPLDDDTPCYQIGEQIKYNQLEPKEIPSIRIYDSTYGLVPPPEYLRSQMYPATCWANNIFGMVVWATHGSSTSASGIINTGNVPSLNDAYPSTTFQGSCTNSKPDDPGNLSYALLKNGSIGANGATTYSWYYPGQTSYTNTSTIGGMAYQYSKRVVELQSCGEALANLKEYLVPGIWENFLVFNLYGDPSVTIFAPFDDINPPEPDPMTFATVPHAIGETSIAMIADTATDPSGVEYYFTCTAGGGHDSVWQSSTDYTDTGLTPGIQYAYTVTARDLSPAQNATAPSAPASAVAGDLPPSYVDAGISTITWSGQPVQLVATVIDDGESALTHAWSATPDDGVVFVPGDNVENPTVTITKDTGDPSTVTLTLAVNDEGNPTPVTDSMTIDVYDDACKAARIGIGLAEYYPADFNGNCITDLEDLAVMAAKWLDNTGLTEPVAK